MPPFSNIGSSTRFSFLFMMLALLLPLSILAFLYGKWRHQIHPVIPNQVYRSAQLSGLQLKKNINRYHIQSILNLRGKSAQEHWYRQEVEVIKNTHIQHYNLSLHSYQPPTLKTLQYLINVLLTAKKPLLIHCQGGADRTGFVSAIVLILNNEHSIEKIQSQYSLAYGVISLNSLAKNILPGYFKWLAQNNIISSQDRFLFWVNRKYEETKNGVKHANTRLPIL